MKILFIGDAADFHVADKYNQYCNTFSEDSALLYSGISIESSAAVESMKHSGQITRYDMSWLMLRRQKKASQIFKNLVKAALYPFQLLLLRRFYSSHPDFSLQSFTMYYILMCYISRVRTVATPQGSEILQRLSSSYIYRLFALRALSYAKAVIVDSIAMKVKLEEYGIRSKVLKNGFDTSMLLERKMQVSERNIVLSVRSLRELYRINEIIDSRDCSSSHTDIHFIYPSFDFVYYTQLRSKLNDGDTLLGKLSKTEMYNLLSRTELVISIPKTDSSPRSVYESIFAGSAVAITYSPFFDELPACMRCRVCLVDLNDRDWFSKALEFSKRITRIGYMPSEEALDMCDQVRTLSRIRVELHSASN